RGGGGRVILLDVQAQHARRFRSPVARRKRRAKRQRHFTKYGAWHAPTERARDPVEQLDHFDLSGNDGVECTFVTLMNGPLSGGKLNVGGGFRETFKISSAHRGKYRDGPHFVIRKHGSPGLPGLLATRREIRAKKISRESNLNAHCGREWVAEFARLCFLAVRTPFTQLQ